MILQCISFHVLGCKYIYHVVHLMCVIKVCLRSSCIAILTRWQKLCRKVVFGELSSLKLKICVLCGRGISEHVFPLLFKKIL